MWREKSIRETRRRAEDFGVVAQEFSELPDSQEKWDRETPSATSAAYPEKIHSWHAETSVAEVSPGSKWIIALSGQETMRSPLTQAISKGHRFQPEHKDYEVRITATLFS